MSGLLARGASRPLQQSDLAELHESDRALAAADALARSLRAAGYRTSSGQRQADEPESLWGIYRRAYGCSMVEPGVCKLLGDLVGFLLPLLLEQLIREIGSGVPSFTALGLASGYWWALAMFAASVLQSILTHQHHHIVIRVGMRAKAATVTTLYRKALRLSSAARGRLGTGKVLNLVNADAGKIMYLFWFIHYIWAAPLQGAIALYMLWRQLGAASLAGAAAMVLAGYVQTRVGKRLSALRSGIMTHTDERIKEINELVQGIRVIKCYAWEDSFRAEIEAVRERELGMVKKLAFTQAYNDSIMSFAPLAVTLAAFVTFALTGVQDLTPTKAFTSLTLFNILRLPLMALPMIVNTIAGAHVAFTRARTCLMADEATPLEIGDTASKDGLVVAGGQFAWHGPAPEADGDDKKKSKEEEEQAEEEEEGEQGALEMLPSFIMDNVSFRLPRGSLTLVLGPVGSGKSSLLSALLGDMDRLAGSVQLNGTVAFCSQEPWIMNATVKENILFGKPYDEARYRRTISVCAMERDLEILLHGENTEIGERGVNLSGGQKARVSLARAVYSDADIYLLDDVLSALDVHVGKHIMTHCIADMLSDKTRLFVTHQRQYLPMASQAIFMDHGQAKLLRGDELASEAAKILAESGGDDASSEAAAAAGSEAAVEEGKHEEESKGSEDAPPAGEAEAKGEEDDGPPGDDDGTLMTEEDRQTGKVGMRTFLNYLKDYGSVLLSLLALLSVSQSVVALAASWWLSVWSTDAMSRDTGFYVAVYGAINGGAVVLILFSQLLWRVGGLRASRSLHNRMLRRITRAPTAFFDTTPVGRIMNRFSNDTDVLDKKLSGSLGTYVMRMGALITVFIMLIAIMPLLLLLFLPVVYGYYRVQQYYSSSSRELKRLDLVSTSPIFAHFSEALSGLLTIRSYQQGARFITENVRRQENNMRANWRTNLINRWLGIRLEVLGALVSSLAALVAVGNREALGAGLAGLALSQAMSITGLLNWAVRVATEAEMNLTSAERMSHYADSIQEEAAAVLPDNRPSKQWPAVGKVEFDRLVLRYRPELPDVLHGISLDIKPSEKIGICGRTGAGKSSLVQALFRLIEPREGTIRIDGVDITAIGLRDLRSRLSIIPQQPVLFQGSVRYNLDPWLTTSDSTLWDMLAAVELRDTVAAMPAGLDSAVMEGGSGWSVGQRQLFCLARTLLRGASLLVLDEATAYVDRETDALVQAALRRRFGDATVLTIAHRLDSIMDSDVLLVLDEGKLVQQGSPEELLRDEAGAFYSLVETARSSGVR
eukprot:PLAT157.2.p1 GENE.PLAT157.2~~PLAT157.2.p1  ORF type:complete len:1456 (-),score=796.76 PLAT157.2:104-3955(-)